MKLTLDAEATVGGYWSDGTANVEIAATLRNKGDLRLDDPVRLAVTCNLDRQVIDGCDQKTSVSLPDGYGPVTETLTVRSPAGKVSFEIDYGEAAAQTLLVDVPERIVGVNRDVWDCFSDTSRAGTFWDEDDNGVGCAAWTRKTVLKWGQESPVRVWLNGLDGFTAEFKDVLTELSPILNIEFDWVDSRSRANFSAFVGLTTTEVQAESVYCGNVEALGCANTYTDSWSGEAVNAAIIVYNPWPDKGSDFGDFGDWHRSRFRSAMIHEAIHVFGRMYHRTEPLSIMNSEPHHRAELTPMDEALLRLHGHELVKPGMTLAQIERLIVFNDELVDPQPVEPQFQAWTLVLNAYKELRKATSAQFRVRSSSPGCSEAFGWADYQVGNLTDSQPYFSWAKIDDGESSFYVLQRQQNTFEYWRRAQSGWATVSRDTFSHALPGWQGDLSDPHHMLESILYYADWSDAEVSIDSDGRVTLRVDLDMTRVERHSWAESVDVFIVIDKATYALLEYSMDWKLGDARCDTYRIEAKDGQLDIEFTFPQAVRRGSDLIDDCTVESLGTLSGSLKRSGRWARECGPDRSLEGYARPYQFSLNSWSFVRFELWSDDDRSIDVNLSKSDGSGDSSTVDPSASGYYFAKHLEPGSQLRWAHVPLPPGSYTVEAVTMDRVSPGAFTLRIYSQPTPPPPYTFKSISAGAWKTCGLLVDGTPLCWGANNVAGEGAEIPEGKLMSISSDSSNCALREDGTPVCWDFKKEGEHTCPPRDSGSVFCPRNDQDPPTYTSGGGGGALASITFVSRAGYNDLTPPDGEKLTSISTRGIHSCGLRRDGTPVCWGNNQFGKASPPAGERFASIDAGYSHTCGLRENGTAVCWGAEWTDLLSVPENERFAAITAGAKHSCGLREDGSIVCWGDGSLNICNSIGGGGISCFDMGGGDDFLPSSTEEERFVSLSSGSPYCALRMDGAPVCWHPMSYYSPSGLAVLPPKDERFTSITSSPSHACALREDGTAVCWGEDAHGQSSPPSGVNLTGDQTERAPTDLASIGAGGYHTCALDSEGRATCWGPLWWSSQFAGRFISISGGRSHACALSLDGTAVCRGGNREGQSSPAQGEVFVSLTGGESHSCGLRKDGTVVCWGSNDRGQASPPAGEVFAAMSSGQSHLCGLRKDGSAVCWGSNDRGQASPPPEEMFVSIAVGESHSCGLRANGTPVCWGSNDRGQASPPVGEVFTSISSGPYHVCGLRKDGSAVCWGGGSHGQASPPADARFVAISCGEFHTCALRADGTAACWGQDAHGQSTPRR